MMYKIKGSNFETEWMFWCKLYPLKEMIEWAKRINAVIWWKG